MLTLPIKKQWYDAILAGKKKIEYREIKPYWTSRFLKVLGIDGKPDEAISSLERKINRQHKQFDVVFRNGYEPDSPSFIALCSLDIGLLRTGKVSYEKYYRLHIKKIKSNDYKEVKQRVESVKTDGGCMEIFNNTTKVVRDDLEKRIQSGSRISIAAACFSIYAYQELKAQLEVCEDLRFIFTSPTFVAEKTPKERREFYIPRLKREKSLYGTEFEVRLRNELKQKAVARECAEWMRNKARFKSNTTRDSMNNFLLVDGPASSYTYMPMNSFTTVDLGCERGNNLTNMVTRLENPASAEFLRMFNAVWDDEEKLLDVTEDVIEMISTVYQENAPELVYFMTLYNIFNEFLEDISEDVLPNEATGFKESVVWNKLFNY